jgi:MYXO-CTERM domain-containing protein
LSLKLERSFDMNRIRTLTPLLTLAAILAATSTTLAARAGKHPPGGSTPWQLTFVPVLHTNQDGVKRSIFDPTNPWSDLGADDIRTGGPNSDLIDLVLHVTLDKMTREWPSSTTAVELGSLGLGPMDPTGMGGHPIPPGPAGSPLPGPGTLVLLGLAGLAGRRRRR